MSRRETDKVQGDEQRALDRDCDRDVTSEHSPQDDGGGRSARRARLIHGRSFELRSERYSLLHIFASTQ
jgi:hypothetical protein